MEYYKYYGRIDTLAHALHMKSWTQVKEEKEIKEEDYRLNRLPTVGCLGILEGYNGSWAFDFVRHSCPKEKIHIKSESVTHDFATFNMIYKLLKIICFFNERTWLEFRLSRKWKDTIISYPVGVLAPNLPL